MLKQHLILMAEELLEAEKQVKHLSSPDAPVNEPLKKLCQAVLHYFEIDTPRSVQELLDLIPLDYVRSVARSIHGRSGKVSVTLIYPNHDYAYAEQRIRLEATSSASMSGVEQGVSEMLPDDPFDDGQMNVFIASLLHSVREERTS